MRANSALAWSGSLLLCYASALALGQVVLSQELATGAGLGGHVGQPFVHVGLEEVGMVQELVGSDAGGQVGEAFIMGQVREDFSFCRPTSKAKFGLTHNIWLICHHRCPMHYGRVVGENRGLVGYSELNHGVTALGPHLV